jgi:hypothetical protein
MNVKGKITVTWDEHSVSTEHSLNWTLLDEIDLRDDLVSKNSWSDPQAMAGALAETAGDFVFDKGLRANYDLAAHHTASGFTVSARGTSVAPSARGISVAPTIDDAAKQGINRTPRYATPHGDVSRRELYGQ